MSLAPSLEQKLRVLLVEDEHDEAIILKKKFDDDNGFIVDHCLTVDTAKNHLANQDYDILVTDFLLPYKNCSSLLHVAGKHRVIIHSGMEVSRIKKICDCDGVLIIPKGGDVVQACKSLIGSHQIIQSANLNI